jgi:hypothetical protein
MTHIRTLHSAFVRLFAGTATGSRFASTVNGHMTPLTAERPGEDKVQAPDANFLIKPFQRERFALAADRGRQ